MQVVRWVWHAVYGGFFILLSFAWGWAVDKERPDTGKHAPGHGTLVQLFAQLSPSCAPVPI